MADQEKTPEAQVQETEAIPTPDPAVLQSELEALKQERANLQKQLADAVSEAKGHQKRVKRNEESETRLNKMESNIEVLTSMIGEVLDKDVGEVETPKERRSEIYLKRLAEEKGKQELAVQQDTIRRLQRADAELKSVGLAMETSSETKDAYIAYLRGDIDGALEKIDDIVKAKRIEAPKVKGEEETKRKETVKEEARQLIEPLLRTDTGSPAGGGGGRTWTTKEIDAMDWRDYKKNFPDYAELLKAIQEGRVK